MSELAKIPLVRERRQEVMEMLLNGLSHKNISDYIRPKYQKGEKTVQKDITIAYNMIKMSHNVSYDDLVARHIGMYYELWQTAKELGDVKGAIAAQQAIEKLLKMHQPDNPTFVQNNTYSFDNLSLEEAKELLLEAKKDD